MKTTQPIIKRSLKPGMFLFIQAFLFLIIIIITAGYNIFNLKREFCVYAVSIVIVVCFLYAIWSWSAITGRLFDPYVLFLVAAMLFTGGQAIIEIFNIKPAAIFDVYNRVQATTVLSALFLVSIGLLSFQSGGMIAALQSMSKKTQTHPRRFIDPNRVRFALRTVGWFLLLLSVLLAINQLRTTINAVTYGGYGAFFQIDWGTGLEGSQKILALFLVPGVLFLLAGSKGKPFFLLVSALLILPYVITQFFIGSRMLAVMPLIAYAWLWHRSIRPLPRMLLLLSGTIMVLVVFPLISVYRTTAGAIRLNSPSLLLETFFSIENPLVSSISEMASTIFPIARTLELVPSFRPFALGSSYYYSLLTLAPNLFWSIHPSSTNELGRWFSWTVSPAYAAVGGGWGFSFVAEAYMNFGWLGMPIVLMLMGYIYARFVLWANKTGDLAKMAFLASFSSFFFLFARGESASLPRYFIWYSFLPYVMVMFITKVRVGSVRSKVRSSS